MRTRSLLSCFPRYSNRSPGESRDPLLSRLGRGSMGPGFRRDAGMWLYAHHDVVQVFAADEAVEIGGEVTPAPVGGALGEPGAMRRHQHIRQLVKREPRRATVGMFRAPVLPPHIERGAAELIAAQGAVERLFVDDSCA